MNIKAQLVTILAVTLMLCSCAGPNPNVGTRTADDAYRRGDCARALDIYEGNAESGKPWAQMRLGMVYYEGRCKPQDYSKAMLWLKRAATYESKTDWENGKEFRTGPSGFFNTRASASNASRLLARMLAQGTGVEKDLVTAWLWANRGLLLANDEDKGRVESERSLIEGQMGSEQLRQAKQLVQSWTPGN